MCRECTQNNPKAGTGNGFYTLFLPVKESPDPDHAYTPEDIDWEHMDAYIRKLMEKNVKELDAYLKAAGLEDYELTDDDREVLSLCGRGR